VVNPVEAFTIGTVVVLFDNFCAISIEVMGDIAIFILLFGY